jgi:hypothetical protein
MIMGISFISKNLVEGCIIYLIMGVSFIPQHQQIYPNSLVRHMQSTGVYYICNSYNRNFGSPAKDK